MDHEVIPLFAKPLYRSKIDVSGVDLTNIVWTKNALNNYSEDSDILSRPDFANILSQLKVALRQYFYDTMGVNKQTKLYFTESWLTKTETGERHHRHAHPNSIISGIVCLSTDGSSGKTTFIDGSYASIEFEVGKITPYNTRQLKVAPEVGNLLLFPSSMEHLVEPYEGTSPRIMLAFNTFAKGTINTTPLVKIKL